MMKIMHEIILFCTNIQDSDYVHDKYGVNVLATICAVDRAVFPDLMDYWVPGVDVIGLHEMVGNALIMPGEAEDRSTDLRGEPLPGMEEDADE